MKLLLSTALALGLASPGIACEHPLGQAIIETEEAGWIFDSLDDVEGSPLFDQIVAFITPSGTRVVGLAKNNCMVSRPVDLYDEGGKV